MVDLFQPLTRQPAANLWDDIQAAHALVSQRGVAQCKPSLPLPLLVP